MAAAANSLAVVTYNLYWWCISNQDGACPDYANGEGFTQLNSVIGKNGPYDLIGFQECNDAVPILRGAGILDQFSYFNAGNDAPMAWRSSRYEVVGGQGSVWIGKDRYGDRHLNWVRLVDRESHARILFANTHGPLNQCDGAAGTTVATRYIDAVKAHQKPGDSIVFTGDFNCASAQETVAKLNSVFKNAATDTSFGGADHIFTSQDSETLASQIIDGAPSDHQMLKLTLQVPVVAAPTDRQVPAASPDRHVPAAPNDGQVTTQQTGETPDVQTQEPSLGNENAAVSSSSKPSWISTPGMYWLPIVATLCIVVPACLATSNLLRDSCDRVIEEESQAEGTQATFLPRPGCVCASRRTKSGDAPTPRGSYTQIFWGGSSS
eukprot:TRINITY_DN73372_c0_g1_i1.p1 TRINITY_DN73372_c0_g1~~TRINITY_DN73372_c0_g1_i1.p1  ORF type:complete len:389 (-),score=41.73 TRINITY_DN73372_c0_g1_i1:183-1319(-)